MGWKISSIHNVALELDWNIAQGMKLSKGFAESNHLGVEVATITMSNLKTLWGKMYYVHTIHKNIKGS